MANKLLWLPESGATIMSTELNALANAASAVDGADYDNATNKYMFASYLLYLIDFAAAPTAGGYFEMHHMYKVDGTNYGDNEDGDVANVQPNASTLVGIFPVRAADEDQYIQLMYVPLLPFAFRHVITNKCGQALTAVDTNLLKIYPHSPELQ